MTGRPRLAIITGPTGSGKSELALAIALAIGGEIINADSLAFYRGLDIGTAKPSLADRARVPHHLVDILDPPDDFSAADFMRLARPLAKGLWDRGRPPLVVGGTGLYLRSLLGGLFEGPGRDQAFRDQLREMAGRGQDLHRLLSERDPVSARRIRPSDPARIVRALEVLHLTGEGISVHQDRHALSDRPFEALTVVIDRPLDEMDQRIRERTRRMFELGLLREAGDLLAKGYRPDLKPLRSVGYRECLDVLAGRLGLQEAQEQVFLRTRRLAKRQRTWFRGQAPQARWLYPDPGPVLDLVRGFLEGRPLGPEGAGGEGGHAL
ncbi:MAG: tRNA (adenosine(37)-N6)-dimethylallyltransferase MiaA [Deltaproteobacteria bacterium]|jgi:tRNA dimethylallyltransferase|nr:tRNA (adenosine(37)-N6)-dimethylallyltransferase MiaA [Deltaproteobacteria bacterium]